MKTSRDTLAAIASVLQGVQLIVLLVVLVGCGADRTLRPDRAWEEVRYTWFNNVQGGASGDVVVRASGEIELDAQGAGASTRGLLAGENLETLTRLIDALPPAGYSGRTDCDGVFVLTALVEGERKVYRGGRCDPDLPPALSEFSERIETWVRDEWTNKPEVIDFRILAQGQKSEIEHEATRIIDNRDRLLATLDLLGSERPLVLPAVDFRTEIVVALFLGTRPSSGYAVSVSAVHRTEGGQVSLSEVVQVPGLGCSTVPERTAPYVLIAIRTTVHDDLLIETQTVALSCGAGGSAN